MGVVIETCIKYPGGPTRMTGTDILVAIAGHAAYSGLERRGLKGGAERRI